MHSGISGSRYYYVITSVNSFGESAPSNVASAILSATGNPPTPPTSILVDSSDSINLLRWNKIANSTSYVLYTSKYPGVNKTSSTKMNIGNFDSYYHSGLTNGTMYYYALASKNSYGESSLSNEVSASPKKYVSDNGPVKGLSAPEQDHSNDDIYEKYGGISNIFAMSGCMSKPPEVYACENAWPPKWFGDPDAFCQEVRFSECVWNAVPMTCSANNLLPTIVDYEVKLRYGMPPCANVSLDPGPAPVPAPAPAPAPAPGTCANTGGAVNNNYANATFYFFAGCLWQPVFVKTNSEGKIVEVDDGFRLATSVSGSVNSTGAFQFTASFPNAPGVVGTPTAYSFTASGQLSPDCGIDSDNSARTFFTINGSISTSSSCTSSISSGT